MWCMVVSPGASLPLRGSIVMWIFRLRPGRMGGMWSFIPGRRVEPPVGRARAARIISLCIKSCFEAVSTIRGDVLSGIFPHSISRIDLRRWAIGSSQPAGLVILLMRVCQWAMRKEANVARRHERAWVTFCGRGNASRGWSKCVPFPQGSIGARLGPDREFGPYSYRGATFCKRSVGWGNCWVSSGYPSSSVWIDIREERLMEIWFPD